MSVNAGRFMLKMLWVLGMYLMAVSVYLLGTSLFAGQPASAEPLLQTTTSWDGGAIDYPDGQAQVTAIILKIDEGDEPPFHCHPVPTMGYVLKGKIEVETRNGDKAVFSRGDSVVEVMRTVHRGIALEAPAEIIVFYAGAQDVPNTVLPADDPQGRYCKS
jgi:quercetin dioxygenase-like cupin family protein